MVGMGIWNCWWEDQTWCVYRKGKERKNLDEIGHRYLTCFIARWLDSGEQLSLGVHLIPHWNDLSRMMQVLPRVNTRRIPNHITVLNGMKWEELEEHDGDFGRRSESHYWPVRWWILLPLLTNRFLSPRENHGRRENNSPFEIIPISITALRRIRRSGICHQWIFPSSTGQPSTKLWGASGL